MGGLSALQPWARTSFSGLEKTGIESNSESESESESDWESESESNSESESESESDWEPQVRASTAEAMSLLDEY